MSLLLYLFFELVRPIPAAGCCEVSLFHSRNKVPTRWPHAGALGRPFWSDCARRDACNRPCGAISCSNPRIGPPLRQPNFLLRNFSWISIIFSRWVPVGASGYRWVPRGYGHGHGRPWPTKGGALPLPGLPWVINILFNDKYLFLMLWSNLGFVDDKVSSDYRLSPTQV